MLGSLAAATGLCIGVGKPSAAWAAVDPMTAISIGSSTLSLMRGFSSRGGGMEAMLQAQDAKLNLIIDQLGEIQLSLTSLKIDIAQLPEKIKGFLRSQHRDELIAGISGAARRFDTLSRARRYDAAAARTPQAQQELANILYTTTQLRSTLTQLPEGRGPEAAAIAALALSLEIATLGLMGYGRARSLAALDDYDVWIASMRSDQPGAILPTIRETVAAHDAIIDRLATTEIGRTLDMAAAKMGAAAVEIGGKVRDPCSLLCGSPSTKPGPYYHFATDAETDTGQIVCPVGWGVERRLTQKPDATLGVRLLSYDATWEGVVAPLKGDVCTLQQIVPWSNRIRRDFDEGRLTKDQIRNQTAASRALFDPRRTAFVSGLDEANFHRARAGQCALGLAVLDQVADQMQTYRNLIT